MYFAIFVVCVIAYVLFLGWCLLALVHSGGPLWTRVLRVVVGLPLLGAIFFIPLAWPFLIMIQKVGGESAWEYALAVVLFPRTLPIYVRNELTHGDQKARVVSVTYPINIAGVRYAPVVQTECTQRELIMLDKGIGIQVRPKFTTAAGGVLLARAGDAFVALDHGFAICSALEQQGRVDPAYMRRLPTVIIRGPKDNVRAYDLNGFTQDPLREDDIVIDPPVIVTEEQPTPKLTTSYWLWPMRRANEESDVRPQFVRDYFRWWLPCVERTRKKMDELKAYPDCKQRFDHLFARLTAQNLPSASPED